MKNRYTKVIIMFLLIPLLGISYIYAEGTKQLQPAATDFGFLQIFDQNTLTRPFATFDAPEAYRLNVSVCNLNEKIYLGFRQDNNDVYYRLKDPNGNVVLGPTLIPNNGQGYIPNHASAVSGPSQVTGSGYFAIEYTPTMLGDYYIEFNPRSPTNITPEKRVFNFIDITVAAENGANRTIKPGRLYSKNWDIQCMSDQNPFKAEMFVYAKDSIVTALDFNNIKGFGFTIAANSKGCTNTGNVSEDRQSRYGNATFPEYKLFLNNPDPDCYPSGEFGNITEPTTITGCDADSRCINVYVNKAGTVEITLDLNGIPGFQPNSEDLIFQYDVIAGHNCIKWDTRNGLGQIVPPGTSMAITVNYFNGLTHLPLFDVEHHRDGYIVNLVRPIPPSGLTKPKLYWDDSRLNPNRGQALDPMVNLEGCDLNGCHKWQDRGVNGPYMETINTWWYANVIQDDLGYIVRDITTDANANTPQLASNDTTVCISELPLRLNGKVTGATGGIWSHGKGTFSSLTNLQGTYNPSPEERANLKATIALTSTGNGECPAVTDSMNIFLQPTPVVNPGNPFSVCINNPTFTITGTVQHATGGRWTGGNGRYFPNNRALNLTYEPNQAELNQGFVTLTLTSTGNGLCAPDAKNVTITFTPPPSVDAGEPLQVCANNPIIKLQGNIPGATGGTWSRGDGVFAPDRNTLDATYTPTSGEIASGRVRLRLTSTGNGNCSSETDNLTINFIPAPTVNAGPDRSICANTSVNLAGIITNGVTGKWSGGTGTFTPDASNTNATYLPSGTENTPGTVIILTLTSDSVNNCSPVSDSIRISVSDGPTVNAGGDQVVCGNSAVVKLSGSITNANGGQWTGGEGYFTPNQFALNAQYVPTANEIQNSPILLILSSRGNDTCGVASDSILVFTSPSPTVEAGNDRSYCGNNPLIQLAGSTQNASDAIWSGGNGIFSPNANTLNATYIPTVNEIQSGYLELKLSALKTSCLAVEDVVRFHFTQAPIAEAGQQVSVCENNPQANVYAYVVTSTGGIWTGGNGTYLPSNTALNLTYRPTPAEVNQGGVTLTLTTTGNGNCLEEKDSVRITYTRGPVVDAGTDIIVCKNNPTIKLSGSISGNGQGYWSGGEGYFTPGNNALNATYIPSTNELNNKAKISLVLISTNNGNCNAESDTVDILLTPSPTINAGPDKSICAVNAQVNLTASVNGATGVIWSGGQGTFTPANNRNTVYRPSINEITSGQVTLTATSTGTGLCGVVSDQVIVRIVPAPFVDAGPDQMICGSETNFFINKGNAQNTAGVEWSTTGNGSFSPSNKVMAPTYNITAADKVKGTLSVIIKSTGQTLCPESSDTMQLTFTPVPVINAGPDKQICTNAIPINMIAEGTPARWTGGNGTFIPSRDVMNPQYLPSQSEIAAGSFTLTAATIANGSCPSVSDQVRINLIQGPSIDVGNNQTICGNTNQVNLAATFAGAGGIIWTTNGNGAFTPSIYSVSSVYNLTQADKSNAKVFIMASTTDNGICPGVKDSLEINISPEITVNAGPDQSYCADITQIQLQGIVNNAPNASWSSTGSGSFSQINSLNTLYFPSETDKNSGAVNLILSTSGSANCPPVSDTIRINFTPAPTIYAGPDQVICASAETIQLSGSMAVASEAIWSTNGLGTFVPDQFNPNASYKLTTSDRSLSELKFVYTTTSQGTCRPVNDTVIITIAPEPTVNAGPDIEICETVTGIPVSAVVTNSAGNTWTSSGNGSFVNPSQTTTIYNPTTQDLNFGSVIFTLTASGNTICPDAQDFKAITFVTPPTLETGPQQNLCINADKVNLFANAQGFENITWSSNGSGSFNGNANNAATEYEFSGADKSLSEVVFTVQVNGQANCPSQSRTTRVVFTPLPVPDAGEDIEVCGDTSFIQLNANAINSIEGNWSSTGSGIFVPNNIAQNARYNLSQNDIDLGFIQLIYTAASSGPCPAVKDTLDLTINPIVIADAGDDFAVCGSQNSISLEGRITNAGSGQWVSSGTGTFLPSANAINSSYIPSPADTATGKVLLTLTSANNGLCKAQNDQVEITFVDIPVVKLGPDLTICENTVQFGLNAQVANTSGGKWNYTGTGTLSPAIDVPNPQYTISENDRRDGQLMFIFASVGDELCPASEDTLVVTLQKIPTINAGPDQRICFDETLANMVGTGVTSSGIEWKSSGTGSFAPNPFAPAATYIPSISDKTGGNVKILISTQPDGICPIANDSLILTITPAPIVEAGPNQNICEDTEGVILGGSIQNAGGGVWVSNGSGFFFPNAQTLNATYIPSEEDAKAGNLILKLVSTNNNNCFAVKDSLLITIDPIPTIDAGPDINICEDVTSISLQAVIENASGAFWQTLEGNGTYNPNASLASTQYIPSASDKARKYVTFLVTASGVGTCNAPSDQIRIDFSTSPILNAGPDKSVCETDLPIRLEGSGAAGEWSGVNGAFEPSNTALTALYTPTPAEVTLGTIRFILTSINNGSCPPSKDSVYINILSGPQITTTVPANICETNTSISLQASITNAINIEWTTSGSGIIANKSQLTTTYQPSLLDIAAGSVTFTAKTIQSSLCKPVSSVKTTLIQLKPTINAGPDLNGCIDQVNYQLSSSSRNVNSILWTGGTGNFSNTGINNPLYTPSATDKTNAPVQLIATARGAVVCPISADTMYIRFTNPPVVDAGTGFPICSDQYFVQLSGTVTNSNGAIWQTAGTGTFSPSKNSLNANYYLSSADKASNQITFVLQSTGSGVCAEVTDQTVFDIFQAPLVTITSLPPSVCEDNSEISISALVTNATGVLWKGHNSGTFDPNVTSLNITYQPSNTEIQQGSVSVTATTTGQAIGCAADSTTITVPILPSPGVLINSGLDQELCEDVETVRLNGVIKVAKTAEWRTSGDGIFTPSINFLQANYIPGNQDKINGVVNLSLTTTDNGNCAPASDTMQVVFTPAPTILAGLNDTICPEVDLVPLNGQLTIASGAIWSTTGTGYFAPDATSLSTSYYLSENDKTINELVFTITSTGNGTCKPVSQDKLVKIHELITINAGPDQEICENETSVNIIATTSAPASVLWTTNGNGGFGNNAALNTTYNPGSDDIARGQVYLTVETQNNTGCQNQTDRLAIEITPIPKVEINTASSICSDIKTIELTGSNDIASSMQWTTNGTGTFTNTATGNSTIYNLSVADATLAAIDFTLELSDLHICGTQTTNQTVQIIPAPIVSTAAVTSCNFEDGIVLSGAVTNAGNGKWVSTGTGQFSPNSFNTTATYFPSANDALIKNITLHFISTDNGICSADTASNQLYLNAPPVANAGTDQRICINVPVKLKGNTNQLYTYNWKSASGTTLSTSSEVTVTSNTNTFYTFTVTDIQGCTHSDTVNISVFNPPALGLDPHYCLTDDLLLDSKPSSTDPMNGSFYWTRNNNLLPNENTPLLYVTKAGNHMVVYSDGNCSVNDETSVTAPPQLFTPGKITCAGNEVRITTSQIPNLVYNWSIGSNPVSTNNHYIVFDAPSDTTLIFVSATDIRGCTALDSAFLIGSPKPLFNISDTSVCPGEQVLFISRPSNLAAVAIYKPAFSWYHNANLLGTMDSLQTSTAGVYIANIQIGECLTADTANLANYPNPDPGLQPQKKYCEEVEKTVNIGSSTSGLTYLWLPDGETTQSINVSKPGIYNLYVTNEFGCKNTDSIIVRDICPPRVFAPTAITINGDGHNENFLVFGKYFTNFTITIFNRWGEVIYHSTDPEKAWDGYYLGDPMPIGVYPWIITYEGIHPEYKGPFMMEGKVSVIR